MTKRQRRTFSTEFKVENVSWFLDQGALHLKLLVVWTQMKQLYDARSTNAQLNEVG